MAFKPIANSPALADVAKVLAPHAPGVEDNLLVVVHPNLTREPARELTRPGAAATSPSDNSRWLERETVAAVALPMHGMAGAADATATTAVIDGEQVLTSATRMSLRSRMGPILLWSSSESTANLSKLRYMCPTLEHGMLSMLPPHIQTRKDSSTCSAP